MMIFDYYGFPHLAIRCFLFATFCKEMVVTSKNLWGSFSGTEYQNRRAASFAPVTNLLLAVCIFIVISMISCFHWFSLRVIWIKLMMTNGF